MESKLTCIVCPIGCSLTVSHTDGKVTSVTGNTCPRGNVYGENEITNPQRSVTSTAKCKDGGVVPVKTKGTISKDRIFECMDIINSLEVSLPVKVGDVLKDNVFGTQIVATKSRG